MPSKWVPLEASPEVFNEWSQSLGLPEDGPLVFQDLWSLDDEMLAFVPKPVKAVLLLFPSRGALAEAREKEEKDGQGKFEGDIWWIKQTASWRCRAIVNLERLSADRQISNACGSIGLLHALLNLPDTGAYALSPDSNLKKFKAETLPLPPLERAKRLDEATFFESAHTAAAQAGQSAVPTDLDVDTHFIAFVEAVNSKGERRVVELDGGREGPFDRGHCDDLLKDTAKIVQEKYIARAEGDVNFNMIALAGQPE